MSTPPESEIDAILKPWYGFVHSEYDGTNSLDDQLAVVDEAKAALTRLIAAEVRRKLLDLRGWIDRNHYQPVNESDRWVQASGEIIAHIDSELEAGSGEAA